MDATGGDKDLCQARFIGRGGYGEVYEVCIPENSPLKILEDPQQCHQKGKFRFLIVVNIVSASLGNYSAPLTSFRQ